MNAQAECLERIDAPAVLHAPRVSGVGGVLLVVGVIAFVALLVTDPARAWVSLLGGALLPAWIGVGALLFLAMNQLGGARWTAPVRRLMEGWSSGLPLVLVAVVALAAFGAAHIFPWYAPAGGAAEHHAQFASASKAAWFSPARWIATTLGAVLLWLVLRALFVGGTGRKPGLAVVVMLGLGYSFALFTWDTVLALDTRFVSAMSGFYAACGGIQMFLALTVLVAVWMARGPLKGVIRAHTLHDLGTWTIGLACVWAYIAFAQYLIIAFAGFDNETGFMLRRTQNGWQYMLMLEAVLRFPVPFLLLLSQRTRTCSWALALAAASILAGGLLDVIWLTAPAVLPNGPGSLAIIPELAVAAGFAGGLLLLALRYWRRHGHLAHTDPDLLPVVNAEHLH